MWLVLIAIGLLDSGATELFAIATTKGLLSVVAVLAALYPCWWRSSRGSCSTNG